MIQPTQTLLHPNLVHPVFILQQSTEHTVPHLFVTGNRGQHVSEMIQQILILYRPVNMFLHSPVKIGIPQHEIKRYLDFIVITDRQTCQLPLTV